MIESEFIEIVIDALLSTDWELTSSTMKGSTNFTQSSVVVGEFFLPYTFRFNKAQNKLSLHIFKEGDVTELLAIVNYEKKNKRWFGRSFSGGYIQIVAKNNQHIWKDLSDPRDYMKQAAPKVNTLHYADDIFTDYVVPPYNILDDFPIFNDKIFPESCVALIACNRIGYFTKCVQALAQNPETKYWPIFLFLDMPMDVMSYKDDNEQHVEIMRKYFPEAYIVRRPCNYGAGKNTIDARRQLFDTLKFSYVYIIEDDIVVAPNYLEILNNLWSWTIKNNYQQNVGVIQGWVHDICMPSNFVDINVDNLWAYSMSRQCWDSIKESVYKYEEDYLFSRYHERPHRTIFKWFENSPSESTREGYPLTDTKLTVLRNAVTAVPSTQEGCILTMLRKKGWLRLSPQVNLAENIGRSGLASVQDYDNMKYDQVRIQHVPSYTEFEEAV